MIVNTILLISLLYVPSTRAKVHETVTFRYKAAIKTEYIHRYSTKLSWSKTRQDFLDTKADEANEEAKKSGKSKKLITDRVISEKSVDDRFRGRVALTNTIGQVVHHELLSALMTEMLLDDVAFVRKNRERIPELRMRCYKEPKDVIDCSCGFMNMLHVLGMGFEISVSLHPNLITEDKVVEDEYEDGSIRQRKEKWVSDESSYEMLIGVHFVTAKNSERIIQKVVKRTNLMLVVTNPEVTKESIQNIDIDMMPSNSKAKFYDGYVPNGNNVNVTAEVNKRDVLAEIEHERQVQESLKAQDDLKRRKLVENAERRERQEAAARLKALEATVKAFDQRMSEIKSLYKNQSYDADRTEMLWEEIEQLLDEMKKVNLETLPFDGPEGNRKRVKLFEKYETDLDMERFMMESKFAHAEL